MFFAYTDKRFEYESGNEDRRVGRMTDCSEEEPGDGAVDADRKSVINCAFRTGVSTMAEHPHTRPITHALSRQTPVAA